MADNAPGDLEPFSICPCCGRKGSIVGNRIVAASPIDPRSISDSHGRSIRDGCI
ncbi:MAG: hypothetical protein U9N83_07980 [Thermodesulfobacteriota bacterium]|nr:hypothetical protein [Thermodesulfobacteriota bacterium]